MQLHVGTRCIRSLNNGIVIASHFLKKNINNTLNWKFGNLEYKENFKRKN